MAINEKTLTKGQLRKLNALRKSLGDKIADKAFAQWMKEQPAKVVKTKSDPVAEKLVAAVASLSKDKSFNLGRCLLYTSPSPRDLSTSRMPSSA